jgi:hypothetical protein
MALLDEMRARKLEELARAKFDPEISEAESNILRDSASSLDVDDPGEDAARPVVRAEFLRWLVTDAEAVKWLDPKGLRVVGATIPTKLDLAECRELPVLFFARCTFQGEIQLRSAEAKGIYIFGSVLVQGMGADRLTVHGPVLSRESQVLGEIRLLGAKITGELDCSGAKLKVQSDALNVDGAEIGGAVFLGEGFESEGAVSLRGAKIAGNLECGGAKLNGKDKALSADGAEIDGGVFFKDGFEAEGEIRLHRVKISKGLDCRGAKLKAKGYALSADGAEIGGSVSLQRCESASVIRFLSTAIRGDIDYTGGKFARVSCLNMRLEGDFVWRAIQSPEVVEVSLAGARVKNLRDDRKSWPATGHLNLDGLEYEELTLHAEPAQEEIDNKIHSKELPLKAEERIEWLMLQPEECRDEAQPWMQLRALLEKKGDRKGAKRVLFRYTCLRAKKGFWGWRPLRVLYAWIEEEPLRILWSIGFFLAMGTLTFSSANQRGAMVETARVSPSMNGKEISPLYPHFQPFIYTLENAIPVIRLGMDERWMPNRDKPFQEPSVWPCEKWNFNYFTGITSYGFLTFMRWLLIIAGWVQATVLVASLAERFKK